MNLTTRVETWRTYWRGVTDSNDVERQLVRLRWLEDFAFHYGNVVRIDEFRALQQQIEMGERKLTELLGDFAVVGGHLQPEQPDWVNR